MLQSKVQPVHGLEIVSNCDWLEQRSTGPVGVTTGVTGSGNIETTTPLLAVEVPHMVVAVAV